MVNVLSPNIHYHLGKSTLNIEPLFIVYNLTDSRPILHSIFPIDCIDCVLTIVHEPDRLVITT